MNTVTAPVKSALASKINWIQVVTLLVTFLTGLVGAFNLDPASAAKVTAGVAMTGQVLTLVVRTFFTTSITKASAKGM